MMEIVRCNNNHFYDKSVFFKCPHCENGLIQPENEIERKRLIAKYAAEYIREFQIEPESEPDPEPVPEPEPEPETEYCPVRMEDISDAANVRNPVAATENQDVKTIDFKTEQRNYFVTGWLVCVEGPDRGHSFNLYYGYNTIGYSRSNSICILEDTKIARKVHCSVVYDDRKNNFYLLPEREIAVYLNGRPVEEGECIHTGDKLNAGESGFVFIAFCEGDRKWKREEMKREFSLQF